MSVPVEKWAARGVGRDCGAGSTSWSSQRNAAPDDPELFATYVQIVGESRAIITEHVNTLVVQLARIVADGAR